MVERARVSAADKARALDLGEFRQKQTDRAIGNIHGMQWQQTPRAKRFGITYGANMEHAKKQLVTSDEQGNAREKTVLNGVGRLHRQRNTRISAVDDKHIQSYSSSSSSLKKSPLEKLLEHRQESASTMVSSTQILGARSESTMTGASRWSEEMPSPILFPSGKLNSKADAGILDTWVTSILDRYAEKMAANQEHSYSLSQTVDELIPALSLALHELTRQVSSQCAERGVVLEKIWSTYVELFDRALKETRTLLRFHKARCQRVEEELSRATHARSEIRHKQPLGLRRLHSVLSAKFVQRQEELDNLLDGMKKENEVMSQLMQHQSETVKTWFPQFEKYKECPYRETLMATQSELPFSTTPEARIASDFKRVLLALPTEARRRVGFYCCSLLGIRGTELVDNPETIENLEERKEHNEWKINVLEQRLKQLQDKAKERSAREDASRKQVEPDKSIEPSSISMPIVDNTDPSMVEESVQQKSPTTEP